jgi:hypothetical protein
MWRLLVLLLLVLLLWVLLLLLLLLLLLALLGGPLVAVRQLGQLLLGAGLHIRGSEVLVLSAQHDTARHSRAQRSAANFSIRDGEVYVNDIEQTPASDILLITSGSRVSALPSCQHRSHLTYT